jgi:hypothetical protein
MMTILASLTGFLSALMPHWIRFLQDKYDKKHELDILVLQLKRENKSGRDAAPDALQWLSLSQELATRYATYQTGIRWVDGFNGSVRPVLAYSFFSLYAAMKYWQWQSIGLHVPPDLVVNLLWNQEDQAIFASIISFYYGTRSFKSKKS